MVNAKSVTNSSNLLTAVRVIGIISLIIGVYLGLQIVWTCWGLFADDNLVTQIAKRVEQNSGIDTLSATILRTAKGVTTLDKGDDSKESESKGVKEKVASSTNSQQQISNNYVDSFLTFKPSYFAGWALTVVLLILVGHIASLTITTGAKLIFYGSSQPPAANSAPLTREDLKIIVEELVKARQ